MDPISSNRLTLSLSRGSVPWNKHAGFSIRQVVRDNFLTDEKEFEMSIDEMLAPSNDCRSLPTKGTTTDKAPASEQFDRHRRLEEDEREIQLLQWQQGLLNEDF